MERLILIKLGGSLITDKTREKMAKPEVMVRLALEIKASLKKTNGKIIVAHGAGSFAHRSASKYRVNEGNVGKLQHGGLPFVGSDAIELNRVVINSFLNSGLPALAFSPESMILSEGRKPKSVFTDSLRQALELKYIPVLYGDVVMDNKLGFCIYSTEMVLGALAGSLKNKYRISFIYCTDTDGVLDFSGNTIPLITKENVKEVEGFITGSGNVDVTGGMIHKVRESLENTKFNFETVIINGNRKNELKNAILGKIIHGTRISA